jgi:hypothetical protein
MKADTTLDPLVTTATGTGGKAVGYTIMQAETVAVLALVVVAHMA